MSHLRCYWKWVGSLSVLAMSICAVASAAPIGETEVTQCVNDILQRARASCLNYVSLRSVTKIDGREDSKEAFIIADVEFQVKQRIAAKSPAAAQCTGTGWLVDPPKNPYPPNSGAWFMFQSQADLDGGYLEAGQELRIRKKFTFELWDSGWRCADTSMSPVDKGWLGTLEPPRGSESGAGAAVGSNARAKSSGGGTTAPGEGAIVVRDTDRNGPAPIYESATGDKLKARVQREGFVGGVSGTWPKETYGFERKSGRVRVLYFTNAEQRGIQKQGWMDENDLAIFSYDCSCAPRSEPCSSLESVALVMRQWNACFIAARDKALMEAKARISKEKAAHTCPDVSQPCPATLPSDPPEPGKTMASAQQSEVERQLRQGGRKQ